MGKGTITLFNRQYRSVILDLDGVVLDSNFIKEHNIKNAAASFYPPETVEEFARYFTALNGVPREEKIFNFFPDRQKAQAVLESYNLHNRQSLLEVPFTNGFPDFLQGLKKAGVAIYILSGGDEQEVRTILQHKGILKDFTAVMGGPVNKKQHLNTLTPGQPVIYFGDSKVDYDTALHFGYDFIFVHGYTQFEAWQDFFKVQHPGQLVIKDFAALLSQPTV